MAVTVTAIRNFPYGGRTIAKGDVLSIASPVEASIMARRGLISLTKVLTRDLSAEPEPKPVPVRRRRSYRRRDLVAESSE